MLRLVEMLIVRSLANSLNLATRSSLTAGFSQPELRGCGTHLNQAEIFRRREPNVGGQLGGLDEYFYINHYKSIT
jgi:hypothetical protein